MTKDSRTKWKVEIIEGEHVNQCRQDAYRYVINLYLKKVAKSNDSNDNSNEEIDVREIDDDEGGLCEGIDRRTS